MSFRGENVLAVVPARGGSKGIPGKNLKQVGGLSLVGHVARTIQKLGWVDAAVISTDDDAIAEEARAQGLEVPFMRPEALSGDTAMSIDVWRHAWEVSEAHYGKSFSVSVLLEPTSPMRLPEDIQRTVTTLLDGDYGSAATVSPTPAHYTPHKTLTLNEDTEIGYYLEQGAQYALRQRIGNYYHRNGICYAARRAQIMDVGEILGAHTAGVVIERPVVNIDEVFELELAGWLMQRQAGDANA